MTPEENLRKVKQELDDAVVAALENLETPGRDGMLQSEINLRSAAAPTCAAESGEPYVRV